MLSKTPAVSVLIPLYNHRDTIRAALESVMRQSFRDFEIIIVDDGSSDGSGDAAASFVRRQSVSQKFESAHDSFAGDAAASFVHGQGMPGSESVPLSWEQELDGCAVRYFRKEHSGISKTRNFALEKARGKLIAFLDSDDLWAPEKLEYQVQYLREHPECDIVFCRYQNFTDLPEAELTKRQKENLYSEISNYLTGACIKKELFSRFGTFNENYVYGEDTEWVARLKLSRLDLSHKLDRVLYFRRIHSTNISLTHRDMTESDRFSIMADAIRSNWKRPGRTLPAGQAPLKSQTEPAKKNIAEGAGSAPEKHSLRLSVIIPAYNTEKYIREAIGSVRRQYWNGKPALRGSEDVELLVVDDGSADRTAQAASEEGCTVISLPNGGAAAARNRGLQEASGDLVFFLDADDVLEPDVFQILFRPMEENPDVDAVFGRAVDFISPDLTREQALELKPAPGPYPGRLTGCALLKKNLFDRAGLFDASLKSGETIEWMLRLRNLGAKIVRIEDVVLRRRLHMTNTGRLNRREELTNYAAILRRRMKK